MRLGFSLALNGATATSGYTAEATALFAAMTGGKII